MIKWRLPSSAPRDGAPFVAKKSNGELENCIFDQNERGFLIYELIRARKRLSPTLNDHVGWLPWQVLFDHVQDAAVTIDRNELNETLLGADLTANALKKIAERVVAKDREPLERALGAIKSLRRLLPKGDWF